MRARIAQLWRSMPVQLAMLLVLLFSSVSLISLAASYAVTQSSFEAAIRADLAQDMVGFHAAPNARAVALLVEAESRETDPNRLILSYLSPGGRLYGNGAIARDDEGYHILSLDSGRAQYSGQYHTLTATLYGGLLTIARSRAEIEALAQVFLNILWISLLPTMLIALSGGLYLARRSKRHVEVIGSTLDNLTTGELSARVEVGAGWSDDLIRIGDKVNQMALAQQASTLALRQVSSDIAHDLKTPIQRVSLHLEDLSGQIQWGDQAALVTRAQEELTGIASVFEALLQLAQVDTGSARARFAPVDLSALCQTLAEVYEPLATEKGQLIMVNVPADRVDVMGDRTLMGQMMANLIENALRHTPPDARVTLSLARQENTVELVVADDGPGIPSDERTKVLQRLYRLDRSRHTLGNGLGLSLVDAVVRLHGAHLVLEDNDPGLRVVILLRLQDLKRA